MINRIKEQFQKDSKSKNLLAGLISNIEAVRKTSDLIAFSPDNTGVHWLGIKNAAIELFGENYVPLPQSFSNSLLVPRDIILLSDKLAELNFSTIIFKGFPMYFEMLFRQIKTHKKAVKIHLLFAGSASEYTIKSHQQQIELAVSLARQGVIDKIGFNKKGLAEAIAGIYKINCGHYIVKTAIVNRGSINKTFSGSISKIGVLGSDTFNKNLHTQVIAALQIPNARVYVFNAEKFSYLQSDRIVGIDKQLPHHEFINLLSQMDVNYYICFSESWGQVVTESLSVGVPCLTTSSSGIFDFDSELEAALVVKNYDDIMAIAGQTTALIPAYQKISSRGMQYVNELNILAEKKMEAFINN